MRYAIRHKETEKFVYVGEESGLFLTDDGKYGVTTYKKPKYAEEFLEELFADGEVWDDGGEVDHELHIEDFEIVII